MIETKHASLDTLAVTIRALHVNGKQMTLAVFRQIPNITETPSGAELWGIVRYNIKDENDTWLVLSSGGILYRRGLQLFRRVSNRDLEYAKAGLQYSRDREHSERRIAELPDLIRQDEARVTEDKAILDNLPQLFIAV